MKVTDPWEYKMLIKTSQTAHVIVSMGDVGKNELHASEIIYATYSICMYTDGTLQVSKWVFRDANTSSNTTL